MLLYKCQITGGHRLITEVADKGAAIRLLKRHYFEGNIGNETHFKNVTVMSTDDGITVNGELVESKTGNELDIFEERYVLK